MLAPARLALPPWPYWPGKKCAGLGTIGTAAAKQGAARGKVAGSFGEDVTYAEMLLIAGCGNLGHYSDAIAAGDHDAARLFDGDGKHFRRHDP